jgi:hypothetical protein
MRSERTAIPRRFTRSPEAQTHYVHNTAAWYMPATGITIIAFVNTQREVPFPGVPNAILRDIARIVTPNNVPYVE